MREPKKTITLDQVEDMRAYFENQQFERLDSILEDFQNEFEIDTAAEYKVHDAFRVFGTTPPHYDSYLMLDYVLLETREWDTIISYWNRFIELEPDHDGAYLERAGTYYHKKDFANSLKDLKTACDLDNDQACKRYHKYKDIWQ